MTYKPSDTCLILHSIDPQWVPEHPDILINCLHRIGLISDKINQEGTHTEDQNYLVGNKFLDLITYMGCSPSIRFTPETNSDKFSHIKLTNIQNNITALTSRHTQAPHCPVCKKAEKHWQKKINTTEFKCSTCGQSSLPWLYNWRRTAGFGRIFIEITDIYPKEAIPQQSLFDQLQNETGECWQYFYYYR